MNKDIVSSETPDDNSLSNVSGELIETLSDIEHERWSGWMNWLYQNGTWGKDGSFTIEPEKAQRWFKLSITRYDELDEETKAYDRVEVRKTLKAIMESDHTPEASTNIDAQGEDNLTQPSAGEQPTSVERREIAEEAAAIAEFIDNHQHQYNCAICSHRIDLAEERRQAKIEERQRLLDHPQAIFSTTQDPPVVILPVKELRGDSNEQV